MSATAKQIKSKIDRADENIEEFQFRAAAFVKANPHVVVGQEHPKRGQRLWSVAYIPPIPDRLASIAADAVGNLGKPLDYIATRIEERAGRVKLKDVYFPVGWDAANYEAQRGRYIQAAGHAAIDAFDAAQPYKGGRGEALWQIHELNSPEKHVSPLTLSGGYAAFDIGPIMRDGWRNAFPEQDANVIPSLFLKPKDRMCPLQVGDVLFAEPIEPKVQENRKFLLEIAFHEPGIVECEPALETLKKFADAVRGIVAAFEPLLR